MIKGFVYLTEKFGLNLQHSTLFININLLALDY